MDSMPRSRPPYLSLEVTRHGRTVWYVRRNGAFVSGPSSVRSSSTQSIKRP
jgi:hypothetical protein